MKTTLTQRLNIGFAAAFLVALAIGFVTFSTLRQQAQRGEDVQHTYVILNQLTLIEKLMSDMETGRRGFRLTGKMEFLQPYEMGTRQMNNAVNSLLTMVGDNTEQLNRANELLAKVVAVQSFYRSLGYTTFLIPQEQMLELTTKEKTLIDDARKQISSMRSAEIEVLQRRQSNNRETVTVVEAEVIIGTIIIEAIIITLIIAILQAFRLRKQAQGELQRRMQELEASNREMNRKNWLLTGISSIKDNLQGTAGTNELAQQVIQAILNYTNAPAGALYIVNEEDRTHLLLAGGIGIPTSAKPVVQVGRGLVGSVALEKKSRIIRSVPGEYWKFESSVGNVTPGVLLFVPFCFNDQLTGVMEIAGFANLHPDALELLEEVSGNVASAFNAMAANKHASRLLAQVREQKEALEQQQEELRQTNEALTQQTEELQVNEEELKVQEEELRQMNTELSLKNDSMESARQALLRKAEELEQSSRYKSEFLANMSHELRTPLNSILLLARILSENKEGNLSNRQSELAETIHKSGEDLLNLINDILDLSKIEAGKVDLELIETDISEMLRNMKDLFVVVAEQKNITFTSEIAPDVPKSFLTDPQRLSQILKNLLSNAFKFTQQGGRVDFMFSLKNKMLCIEVKDNGMGIPKNKQELIFDAFRQADGGTSRKFGGTGLGLSITRELVQLFGGTIGVQSAAGKGSTFTVKLPLEPANKKQEMKKGDISRVGDDRDDLKAGQRPVLIIEDDADFATILRNVAREAGYKTVVALRGDEGLECARKYHPAAILLDMHLPVMDGWQLSAIFRKEKALRNIPVHVISSHDAQLPEGSAVTFLKKPIGRSALAEAFRNIGKSMEREVNRILILSDHGEEQVVSDLTNRYPDLVIHTAANKEAALKLLQEYGYDCMIADIGTDFQKGVATLKDLQALLTEKSIPVIVSMESSMTPDDELQLRSFSDVVIHHAAKSDDRLADEVELFLNHLQPDHTNTAPRVHLPPDHSMAGKKVLIADDDMRNVFALNMLLEEQGMKVITAADGKEALSRLAENPDTDIVLMDIMMPEMDGYEAIRELRKQPAYKKLPVITLTAKAMPGDRELSIKAGASDYIAKPVDSVRLISLLRVWLSR